MSNIFKGICYDAFPHGYNLNNDTCIWFGSDMARYELKALWGDSYTPIDGKDAGKTFKGRNDLRKLKDLGVNLIRLYDWDSRNDHLPFMDYCEELGLKILAPVSNYNFGAFGTPPDMQTSIIGLINSFSNREKTDYHSAIYGITFGSELDLPSKMSKGYLGRYTRKWMEMEERSYSDYRTVPIMHPTSFDTRGEVYPCFAWWDDIYINERLIEYKVRNCNKRLVLCPHTYNEGSYLYNDPAWVDKAYERYSLPILFGEMGCSRLVRNDYVRVIEDQLNQSFYYVKTPANEGKLLGVCHFQYCDKVWIPNTTEGSFGIVHNTDEVDDVVSFGCKDFSHSDGLDCGGDYLNIQRLGKNMAYGVIKDIYGQF